MRGLRIVRQFRFFFCIQVIQVAEEFIDLHGWEKFVSVAEVVFAELSVA